MATSKLSLSFRISKDGQLVRETTLSQGVIKIGKVPSAHLHLDDELVSRMHAILEVVGDEVSVIDLGSTGGTFVNGQRVNKAKLRTGDVIVAGNSQIEIAFGATVSVATNATVATPAPAPVVRAAPAIVRPPAIPMAAMPATVTMPAAVTAAAPSFKPLASGTTPVATIPAFQTASSSDIDDTTGARAVEVAAMLGDSVVSVKHCMDAKGGKVTPATWGFLAGGIACLLAAGTATYSSMATAATNRDALTAHRAKGKPDKSFRPQMVSPGVDFVAFGGLALGLIGLTGALARSRRERKNPSYRIGTAPGVELAIENAPSPSFPLVAPVGDDFVFNFAPGKIDGEMIVDGKSTPLAELVSEGRAQRSRFVANAIEVPIPANARIRARAGQTTFMVSAVAKPRATSAPLFNIERRTAGYVAGSLAAHLAVIAFLSTLPIDDSNVSLELAGHEDLTLRGANITNEDPVHEKEQPDKTGDTDGSSVPTAAMALDEGQAGKPNAVRSDGNLEIKNNNSEQQLSREQAIQYARNAGVLGSEAALRGGIAALTANADWSSGWSDADIYGPLFGSAGEGRGNFGMGRREWGPGGGCPAEPCGTVGVPWGKIKIDTRPGDEWGMRSGSWGRPRNHTAGVPPVHITQPSSVGGNLDKAIIKRYIKRAVHKLSYCYESELLARPGIEGTVMVNFLISGTGVVQSSAGNGFDPKVASCVASVIKNIEFPRPQDGGNVQVNYPFTFRAPAK